MARFWVLGPLAREFIVPPEGRPAVDVPGGAALYGAVGATLWAGPQEVGLVSRVGEGFPRAWLEDFAALGWDVRGVRVVPATWEQRRVLVYEAGFRRSGVPPAQAFLRRGMPFPHSLLGYEPPLGWPTLTAQPGPMTLRPEDLPEPREEIRAALLTPLDWPTHLAMPAALQRAGTSVIALLPDAVYLDPQHRDRLPLLLRGLTAFLPSLEDLQRLFADQQRSVWEMAEAVAAWGVDWVVVRRGWHGYLLLDAVGGRRWEVPAYPAPVRDPTGSGEAFGGGFLVGALRTFDPLEAVLYGAVAASVVAGVVGALPALEVLPGLLEARLEALRPRVRRV